MQRVNGPTPSPLWSFGYCSQGWRIPAPQARARTALRFAAGVREGSARADGAAHRGTRTRLPGFSARPSARFPRWCLQGCSRAPTFPQAGAARHQTRASRARTRALLRGPLSPGRSLPSSGLSPGRAGPPGRGEERAPRLRTVPWEVWCRLTCPAPSPRRPSSRAAGGRLLAAEQRYPAGIGQATAQRKSSKHRVRGNAA